MSWLLRLLPVLVPICWSVALARAVVAFRRGGETDSRGASRVAWVAALVHAVWIAALGALAPAELRTAGGTMSALGLSVALVHLLLERRVRSAAVTLFPLGVALVGAVVAAVMPGGAPVEAAASPPVLPTVAHAAGSVLGYAGLILAGVYGGLYLALRRALRRREFGLLFQRLPALELLDQFCWRSLGAAALFLTAAIAGGHVLGRAPGYAFDYWDPKVMFTNLLWAGALLLALSRRFDWLRPGVCATSALVLLVGALSNMVVVDVFSEVHPT